MVKGMGEWEDEPGSMRLVMLDNSEQCVSTLKLEMSVEYSNFGIIKSRIV